MGEYICMKTNMKNYNYLRFYWFCLLEGDFIFSDIGKNHKFQQFSIINCIFQQNMLHSWVIFHSKLCCLVNKLNLFCNVYYVYCNRLYISPWSWWVIDCATNLIPSPPNSQTHEWNVYIYKLLRYGDCFLFSIITAILNKVIRYRILAQLYILSRVRLTSYFLNVKAYHESLIKGHPDLV